MNKPKPAFDQLLPFSALSHPNLLMKVLTVGFAMSLAGPVVAQTAINTGTQGITGGEVKTSPIITRLEPWRGRLSRAVIHGDTVYTAGITSSAKGIVEQTRDVLDQIDGLLEATGSDKHHLLTAQIWLKDIATDYEAMNNVWVEWLPKDALPTRATGEVKLAAPHLLVEIIITAAKINK